MQACWSTTNAPYTRAYQDRETVTGGRGSFDLIVLHCESALPGRVASLVARFESRSGNGGGGRRATDRRGNTYNLPCCLASGCQRKRIGRDGGEDEERVKERERKKQVLDPNEKEKQR